MSAIIGSLIPKIEGFQPIPNSVMVPFMETQSAALAFAFGLNYEFGKRTVRSMSNERFNSLTSEQIAEMSAKHSEILLQRFILAVPKVLPMQQEIFKQYVTIEKMKVQENVNLAKWMVKFAKETIDDTLAHAMGGHIHPDDTVIGPQDTNAGKSFSPDPSQGTYNPNTGKSTPPPVLTTPIPPPLPDTPPDIQKIITIQYSYWHYVGNKRTRRFITSARTKSSHIAHVKHLKDRWNLGLFQGANLAATRKTMQSKYNFERKAVNNMFGNRTV